MGTETYKLQDISVRFAVDKHQIRFDVTIPMVLPITCQGVISVLLR